MNNSGCGAEVDETVQFLPPLSAQPSNRARSGGQRERQHQRPRCHARSDEPAFRDVVQHGLNVEKFVEPHVGHQVESAVKKCEEPEHAPETNEPGHFHHSSSGRDAQRDQKKCESPPAGGACDYVNRIGPEQIVRGFPRQDRERAKAD